jgi:mono/diheme cytochrome c family protein
MELPMKKSIFVAAAVSLQFAVCSIAVAQTPPASPLIGAPRAAIGSIVKDARSQIKAVAGPGSAAALSAQQRSAVHAIVQTARTNAVAAGATRRQVQDIRAAVKARLPVVRR